MRKIKKILMFVLIMSMLFCVNVYAKEDSNEVDICELLESREPTNEWYDAFIEVFLSTTEEYRPQTMYDYFPTDEIDLIYRVVMAEIGSDYYTFEQKANVADVNFYRWRTAGYPSIRRILTPNQFSTVASGRIWRVVPTEEVKKACQYAFWFGGSFNGAYFFNGARTWDGYYPYLGTDGAHHFYGLKR